MTRLNSTRLNTTSAYGFLRHTQLYTHTNAAIQFRLVILGRPVRAAEVGSDVGISLATLEGQLLEGRYVGVPTSIGASVGITDGYTLGAIEGNPVGLLLTDALGFDVGTTDGMTDGFPEGGTLVGQLLGSDEGANDGLEVGLLEGVPDKIALGSDVVDDDGIPDDCIVTYKYI